MKLKLYTEEQVKEVINLSRNVYKEGHPLSIEEILKQLNPIELQSDEEIKEYSNRYSTMHEDVSDKLGKYLVSAIHIDGANWMKGQLYDGVRLKRFIKDEAEQILNQNQ